MVWLCVTCVVLFLLSLAATGVVYYRLLRLYWVVVEQEETLATLSNWLRENHQRQSVLNSPLRGFNRNDTMLD